MIGRALLPAVLALAASPVWAQAIPDRGPGARRCRDDAGVDRCESGQQAKVRALFDVQPIEALQAGEAIVYRAFFVDGYGRDMPMVSFERWPGLDPEVVVRPPRGATGGPAPLRAGVSAKVWDSVVAEARLFDRELTPLPASPSAPPAICLHSWVATVEVAEPVRRGEAAPRRKTEDACGGGLAITYAFKLAALARDAIPACAVLDMERRRNEVALLAACTELHGDRMAAAQVQEEFAKAVLVPQAASPRLPPFSINTRTRLSWAGENAEGWKAAGELWRARAGEAEGLGFSARRYEGETARRVRVSGEAGRTVEGRRQAATFEQTWVFDPNLHDWVLESWTVGAFKP